MSRGADGVPFEAGCGFGADGGRLDSGRAVWRRGADPIPRRDCAADLDPTPVRSVDELGWDGDAREAAAFALFARQHMLGLPLDLGWATGAEGPRILGMRVPV